MTQCQLTLVPGSALLMAQSQCTESPQNSNNGLVIIPGSDSPQPLIYSTSPSPLRELALTFNSLRTLMDLKAIPLTISGICKILTENSYRVRYHRHNPQRMLHWYRDTSESDEHIKRNYVKNTQE
ncbi:hypothetical protein PROFUN_16738 [Planoprotostelium fungivorum]|uniref:Uncharacterized protein n=1 Tax=Planoprotostelium fungivorum TaxID=1890364 RepID=A0A2P6MPP9_9EUKA|nr:hypothetical protein PROFUN_16738 [Planoprotostelium fungivorum]